MLNDSKHAIQITKKNVKHYYFGDLFTINIPEMKSTITCTRIHEKAKKFLFQQRIWQVKIFFGILVDFPTQITLINKDFATMAIASDL